MAERVYNHDEVERILLHNGLRPLPGDVVEWHGRQAIVLEYHNIQNIDMDSNTFGYNVVLHYTVLVGLEKQRIRHTVKLSEELLREKLP